MEVLRRCSLAIAQRLVHCAIAVSTSVLGQSHKDIVRCTAVEEQLEAKEVQLSQPSSTYDLFWANLKVQLHLPPLDLLISPGTLTQTGSKAVCNTNSVKLRERRSSAQMYAVERYS